MTAFFSAAAVMLGAIVGSFLNACIYRMPRGVSLLNPRRSFCPSCNKTIPWSENLPVVSWVLLRGKCSGCGMRISPRYLLVEVLTAVAFFALWDKFGAPLAVAYWFFAALLIVATFIDIGHFIIPDEITWGGAVAGLVFSAVLPRMMETDSHVAAAGLSLAGGLFGFALLWLVVEAGKLAFGKKKHVFNPPEEFTWIRDGDRADVKFGAESLAWEDIFSREKDMLVISVEGGALVDGRALPPGPLRFSFHRLLVGGEDIDLDEINQVGGLARSVVIPREAMGFGDVKFIACIGAFLGWQAVLFTLCVSSIVGSVAGLAGIFLARDKAGARVPFGPFLALGAAWWLFGGHELTEWYLSHFQMFGGEPL